MQPKKIAPPNTFRPPIIAKNIMIGVQGVETKNKNLIQGEALRPNDVGFPS